VPRAETHTQCRAASACGLRRRIIVGALLGCDRGKIPWNFAAGSRSRRARPPRRGASVKGQNSPVSGHSAATRRRGARKDWPRVAQHKLEAGVGTLGRTLHVPPRQLACYVEFPRRVTIAHGPHTALSGARRMRRRLSASGCDCILSHFCSRRRRFHWNLLVMDAKRPRLGRANLWATSALRCCALWHILLSGNQRAPQVDVSLPHSGKSHFSV